MAYIPKEIKNRPEIVFNLVEEGFRENFAIWVESLRAFVREGTVTDKDGKINDVKALKFMKTEKFQEHYPFPQFSRSTTYDYKVLIDGEEYMLPLKSTAKAQLEQIIGTLKATGQNPFTTKFKLSHSGSGKAKRYKVEIVTNSQSPTFVPSVNPTQPVVVIPQLTQVSPPMVVLNDIEKQLITYIKTNYPTIEFEQVKDSFLKYNITEERARQIFKQEMGK